MARLQILDLRIGVRVPASQPNARASVKVPAGTLSFARLSLIVGVSGYGSRRSSRSHSTSFGD